jgi:hypothetical protein
VRSAHLVAAGVLLALVGACDPTTVSAPSPGRPSSRQTATSDRARVAALRAREAVLRAGYSPLAAPPWLDVSGADPYRIVPWPEALGGRPDPLVAGSIRTPRFVGVLRGLKALVTLDDELGELGRVSLPEAPTALCVSESGSAFVASKLSRYIQRVELGASGQVSLSGRFQVEATGVRDLACGEAGQLYALTSDPAQIVTLDRRGRELGKVTALRGGLRLLRKGPYLLELSLFERALRVLRPAASGASISELGLVRHDGPIWAADALVRDGGLLVALVGPEDKPLVRARGEFENVDSVAYFYRYDGRFTRLLELNLGEHGLIVPKAVALAEQEWGLTFTALSSGSGSLLRARWDGSLSLAPTFSYEAVPPGGSDAVFASPTRVVYPSPLLDAWIDASRRGVVVRHVEPERRPTLEVRLGEALFFTELMAPDNVSSGTHSRFSCETCHFEGGVDGRTHYTGRAQVSVVTKPLFGLANNRPHFSRALDPDLSAVCHNEFRVAGAGSGAQPWFSLSTARFPWLRALGIERAQLDALELREALLAFLYAFAPEPNPTVLGRTRFSELEARGARAFAQRCEGCHSARSSADDASSRALPQTWEKLVLRRDAPLVWARGDYERSGLLPYVHERGTRIPSLRRVADKPRYFTSGEAPSLAAVLERFSQGPSVHPGGRPPGEPAAAERPVLDAPTREALLAFLRLL